MDWQNAREYVYHLCNLSLARLISEDQQIKITDNLNPNSNFSFIHIGENRWGWLRLPEIS